MKGLILRQGEMVEEVKMKAEVTTEPVIGTYNLHFNPWIICDINQFYAFLQISTEVSV